MEIEAGTVLLFGDSCEVEVGGTSISDGGLECDKVVLSASSAAEAGDASASWWGASIHCTASYPTDYVISENAINNIVFFDDSGVVSISYIRHAVRYGVIFKNAGDSGASG